MPTLIKGSPHVTSTHPTPGKLTKSDQYRLIKAFIPPPRPGGRSRTTDMRLIWFPKDEQGRIGGLGEVIAGSAGFDDNLEPGP